MKFTRHSLMWLTDPESVPAEEMTELDQDVSDYLWPLLGDYVETFSPFARRFKDLFCEYLYEIDPIGIRDDKAQNSDEYSHEAGAIFWLLKNDRLTTKAIWAIWIFYFSRDISPYKEDSHPVLQEMLQKSKELYQASHTEPID